MKSKDAGKQNKARKNTWVSIRKRQQPTEAVAGLKVGSKSSKKTMPK